MHKEYSISGKIIDERVRDSICSDWSIIQKYWDHIYRRCFIYFQISPNELSIDCFPLGFHNYKLSISDFNFNIENIIVLKEKQLH